MSDTWGMLARMKDDQHRREDAEDFGPCQYHNRDCAGPDCNECNADNYDD